MGVVEDSSTDCQEFGEHPVAERIWLIAQPSRQGCVGTDDPPVRMSDDMTARSGVPRSSRRCDLSRCPGKVRYRRCGCVWSADVRAVSRRIQRDQLAAADMRVDIGAHLARGDGVLTAFDHQRGQGYPGQIGAVVREECGAGEHPGAARGRFCRRCRPTRPPDRVGPVSP